ncbi:MAG: cell division protein FtsA [Lentimonas sp.]|jgi:cell division protein FtsA
MSHSRVVAAVEIGTSKVVVLLGEIVGESGLNIIGHSVCSSRGIKKGVIADLNLASDCVHAAILSAEKNAQAQIDEVYLSQTGSHLQGSFNIGTANVSSSDGIIRSIDIDQAKQDAKRRTLPNSRTYIHHIQNPFSIDGSRVERPLSKEGQRLQVGYWSVHGDSEIVSDSLRVIRGIDLNVSDMIISSIASGAVILEDSEKENGALVIDIGGGTSDYVLYQKGYIVKTGVIPVGGDHITNDLSIGLRIARKGAEEFKINYGRAYFQNSDRDEKVWLFGDLTIGDREYPLASITKIIEARVSEIFLIIKDQLKEADLLRPKDIASGVYLTGGTARLSGIAEAAQLALGLEARVAEGPRDVAPELSQPEYSTALGLLHYALTGQEEVRKNLKPVGLLRRISSLLNFD